MTDTLPVIVVGGGIGGLAAVLALAQRGQICHIIERRAHLSEDGAGIQIGPNGVKILRALGVADALRPVAGAPGAIRVCNARTGQQLATLPLGPWIEDRHRAPYWTAHRADLHAALLHAAQRDARIGMETGVAVATAVSADHGVIATTNDGRALEGMALIGADGLWSTIRARHFDGTPPRSTGLAAARAVIPAGQFPLAFAHTDTGVWLLPGAHIVHYPVRGGAEIALVLIFRDHGGGEAWSAPMSQADVAALKLPLHHSIGDVIANVSAWTRWPLVTRAPLTSWSTGRIALLGDAAHPVLPFLAQGAVMALEDAVSLAACITTPGVAMHDALQYYQVSRMDRCNRVAKTAFRNGQIYHRGGLMAVARNTVLRAMPGTRVMAGYDWLYGFTSDGLR
jgi:salicylate hydroxylase